MVTETWVNCLGSRSMAKKSSNAILKIMVTSNNVNWKCRDFLSAFLNRADLKFYFPEVEHESHAENVTKIKNGLNACKWLLKK